jgi:hypothetical protein
VPVKKQRLCRLVPQIPLIAELTGMYQGCVDGLTDVLGDCSLEKVSTD